MLKERGGQVWMKRKEEKRKKESFFKPDTNYHEKSHVTHASLHHQTLVGCLPRKCLKFRDAYVDVRLFSWQFPKSRLWRGGNFVQIDKRYCNIDCHWSGIAWHWYRTIAHYHHDGDTTETRILPRLNLLTFQYEEFAHEMQLTFHFAVSSWTSFTIAK